MNSKRQFNMSERMSLFDEVDGKCAECGRDLEIGWHADHMLPFSKGGATVIENGRALCATCNLKKGAKYMESPEDLELRDCQIQCRNIAIERFKTGHQITAVYMSVGSGKTRAGAIIAAWLVRTNLIDRIIVVCPNIQIAGGWSRELSEQGLRVLLMEDGNTGIERDLASSEHGYITTYQSVARQEHQHRKKCHSKTRNGGLCRTLVILDELHHLGEDPLSGEDRTQWAAKADYAFGEATHILALTGTPDRTDSKALPFIKYEDDADNPGIKKADLHYRYSYGEAVNDGYVRRCAFEYVQAEGEVNDDAGQSIGRFATGEKKSSGRGAVERAALNIKIKPDVSGKAADDILSRGIEQLRALKRSHPRAAGLVVCAGIKHAEYVATLLRSKGQAVVLVHSKMDKASDIIDAFKSGSDDWIVAVGMITEGVNIQRLRGCCYLTTITANLSLDQIMGRAVRVDWQDDGNERGEVQAFDDVGQLLSPGEAFFFCLDKPELVKWAHGVEKEIEAFVRLPESDCGGGGGGGLVDAPELDVISLLTRAAGGTSAGEHLEEVNLAMWRKFTTENPGVRCQTHEGVRIIDFFRKTGPGEAPSRSNETKASPKDYTRRVADLKKECFTIVGRIVKRNGLDKGAGDPYRALHKEANRQAGIPYGVNPDEAQLKKKKQVLLEIEKLRRAAA